MNEGLWLSGKVVEGLKNGRKFGFPTINISLDTSSLIEDTGVFATQVRIGDEQYNGMLYIGTRPTLDLMDKTVEINLFDFDRECYGEEVRFMIGKKIRPEMKFSTVEELINQLKKDKNEILQLYNN